MSRFRGGRYGEGRRAATRSRASCLAAALLSTLAGGCGRTRTVAEEVAPAPEHPAAALGNERAGGIDPPGTAAVGAHPQAAGTAEATGETTTGAQGLFDEVWAVFDRTYPYFVHKGIDWAAVRERHRPEFASPLEPRAFAERLGVVLAELHDWHVQVTAPDGTVYGYSTEYPRNFPTTPRNRYAPRGYRTLGDRVVWHAWLEGQIAYVRIDSLEAAAFASIPDADIEALFAEYRGAKGFVVDLRPNNGGDERVARRFASHFTTEPRVYGYTRVRSGPGHGDLGPAQAKTLEPAATNLFAGPTAVLVGRRCMSSAEWFVLMMRACPNVRLVGDRTRGASGNPEQRTLPNGVSYTVSTWVALTPEGEPIEDRGIAPDVPVDPQRSLDEAHDYVLEKALELLRSQGGGHDAAAATVRPPPAPRNPDAGEAPAEEFQPLPPGFEPLPPDFDPLRE